MSRYIRRPDCVRVNCRYGAPMGRADSGELDGRVLVRMVPLDQGYDRGGAYWGQRQRGESLFVAYTADAVEWHDARTYLAVQERIREAHPGATFEGGH